MDPKPQLDKLSGAHLRLFMSILLQNETVFQQFYGKLAVAQFSDESYQLLYRVLLDFWDKQKTLPAEAELYAEIEAFFDQDDQIISAAGRADLEDVLSYAYDPDTFGTNDASSSKMTKFAFRAGKKFLTQVHVNDVTYQLKSLTSFDNLSGFFSNAATQAEWLALNDHTNKPKLTLGEKWDKTKPFVVRSTGLSFLDDFMGGGARENEAYGLMAPYGTCKTTLAVMLWSLTANQCYNETLDENWDGKKGLSFLVTYEAPLAPEIQHRVVMYSAQIHRDRLEAMGTEGLDALQSDPDNPLPYEQDLFKQQISDGVFLPETKRIEKATSYINDHTVCLDFTGADEDWPHAGHGGVSEIIQRINLELRNRGKDHYVKNVIIDYLGLMVDQDGSENNSKKEEDHKLYQKKVQELIKQVAVKFKCHLWVLHQLSGSANAMLSPTKTLHHTDAKGSKSFGENFHFMFVVGNLNMDQMGQIACTKFRRSRRQPPKVIRVEGEFNNVVAPENYHIDSHGKIVDPSTAQAIGGNTAFGNQSDDFQDDGDEDPALLENENSEHEEGDNE